MPVWMAVLVVVVSYFAGAAITAPVGAKIGWINVRNGKDTDGRRRINDDRPNLTDDWPELLIVPVFWPLTLPMGVIYLTGRYWGRFVIDHTQPGDIAEGERLKQLSELPDLRKPSAHPAPPPFTVFERDGSVSIQREVSR